MSKHLQSVLREAGAAFAVLAIYVLTLLTPLHQSAATQRGFAALGYETIGAWSICTNITEASDEEGAPAALNCPVAGIGKVELAMGASASGLPELFRLAIAAEITTAPALPVSLHLVHQARPRAPPVPV